MAGRIRTFKPEFYQHEGLQELETEHMGKYPMFVYQGLWSQCDCQGVFVFKPKTLKLHILPFIDFSMSNTLKILNEHGYIVLFESNGVEYGFIPTFRKHQVLQTKEIQGGAKYPAYQDVQEQYRNGTETVPKLQEGKGKERKGKEGKGSALEKNDIDTVQNDETLNEKPPPRNFGCGSFVQEQTHILLADTLEMALAGYPANVAELLRHLGSESTRECLNALVRKYAAHHVGKLGNQTLTIASHFANLSKWARTEKGFIRPKSEKEQIVMTPQPFVL